MSFSCLLILSHMEGLRWTSNLHRILIYLICLASRWEHEKRTFRKAPRNDLNDNLTNMMGHRLSLCFSLLKWVIIKDVKVKRNFFVFLVRNLLKNVIERTWKPLVWPNSHRERQLTKSFGDQFYMASEDSLNGGPYYLQIVYIYDE